MECSVCKNSSRHKYCEVCGNNTQEEVDPATPGLAHLTRAYSALMEPDYRQALTDFQQALKFKDKLPPNLSIAAFFEYCLTIVRAAGGGPLRKLATPQLVELTNSLKEARRIYETLPPGVIDEIRHKDYAGSISFNLHEAERVLGERGVSQRADNAAHPPASPSGGGCFSVMCLGAGVVLFLSLALLSGV